MTRSDVSPHSPKVVRKAFRAQAASKGLSFKAAILADKARDEEEGKKFEKPVGSTTRRNPGRMDGVQWNGDSFVCRRQIDGDESTPTDPSAEVAIWEPIAGAAGDEEKRREYNEPMVVSLMDIARPAKQRGKAGKLSKKHKAIQRILDLESINDNRSERSEEEWEVEGSEVWDVQSEQWETQSEIWEIPERDYGAEEWEELYGGMYDRGAQRPNSR
ncbi:peptide hydrolase [Favolaschia claudopus]|uniref:Peptide hydrolase n=1 Tax=Favolaschia claudopus TaxID=2862362 RepID=A0AAW0CKY1_9AGAR